MAGGFVEKRWTKILRWTLVFILLLVSAIGFSLCLASIGRTVDLQTRTNVLIISLLFLVLAVALALVPWLYGRLIDH